MKIHFIAFLFFFIIITRLTYAQNYRKGFVIKSNKDTIHGYIFDKTDSELTKTVSFSNDVNNGHQVVYTVDDLLGFEFMNGRTFERITFRDSINDTSNVFAKKIIEGKIRLYLWRKNAWNKFDFFLFNSNPEISVHLTEPVKEVIKDEYGVEQTYEKISHIGLIKYIKNDTLKNIGKYERIHYSENKIVKNIYDYDKVYDKDYPVKQYKEKRKYFYDITLGYPILWAAKGTNFRAAFYFNRFHPERNRVFSLLAGVSYRFWKSNESVENKSENNNLNYKQQWVSVIPIGIQFRSANKVVRPYFYMGIGVQLLLSENYKYTNGDALGTITESNLLPALNIGTGIKIKVRSTFITIEITPTGNLSGTFANIGYSFQ